ncbi:hypothetical protein DFQ30_003201 [Apophysomyces sp. BC1015]|nr:hypothetical protein DFQ30_003201 [Apophysomyces sp. BC1015]
MTASRKNADDDFRNKTRSKLYMFKAELEAKLSNWDEVAMHFKKATVGLSFLNQGNPKKAIEWVARSVPATDFKHHNDELQAPQSHSTFFGKYIKSFNYGTAVASGRDNIFMFSGRRTLHIIVISQDDGARLAMLVKHFQPEDPATIETRALVRMLLNTLSSCLRSDEHKL